MYRLSIAAATLCLMLAAAAQTPDFRQAAFRQAAWGMSQAEVLATEHGPPAATREASGETVIRFDGLKLAGMDASVVYIFVQDKLVRAKYLLNGSHAELNDFIADYRAVEPVLRSANGQPTDQKAVWLDDSLQEERKSYLDQDRALAEDILPSDRNVGLAVSKGFLKLYTEWSTASTHTLHALTGADGAITHQVEYRSVELSSLEDRALEQAKGLSTDSPAKTTGSPLDPSSSR